MATTWKAPTWRMPNEKNQNKFESYSLDFGSATQYISTPSTWQSDVGLDNATKVSFSVWVNPNSGTGSSIMAVTSQAYGSWNGNFNITYTANITTLALEFRGAGGIFTNSSTTLASDTWHHICFVLDLTLGGTIAQEVRCFVNNSEVVNQSSQNPPLNFVLKTTPFNFGRTLWGESSPSGSGYQWQGKIAQACFFDYPLSEPQIASLYNSGSPINPMTLKPAPIAYYPLGVNASTGGDPLTATTPNTLSVPNIAVPDASVFKFDDAPSNNFIDLGLINAIENSTSFTLSFWINPSAFTSPFTLLGNKTGYSGDSAKGIAFDVRSTFLIVYLSDDFTDYARVDNPLSLNEWTLLSVVYDGSGSTNADRLKIYYGSTQQTVNTFGGTIPSTSPTTGRSLILGKQATGQCIEAKISNFTIFSNALPETGTESIETLYNNGVPLNSITSENLKAWYKLDQSANWEADSSGDWQIPDARSAYPQSFDFVSADGDRVLVAPVDAGTGPINSINGAMTVSIWVKTTQGTVYEYAINRDYIGGSNRDWSLFKDNFYGGGGRMMWSLFNTSGSNLLVRLTGSTDPQGDPLITMNDGKWHHIVGVYNGTDTAELYTDGILQGSATSSGFGTLRTNARTVIGGYNNSSNPFSGGGSWNGKLSNAQIWDTNLNATQVETLYNNGVPLTTAIASDNLKAWYKLDNTDKWNSTVNNWNIYNNKYPIPTPTYTEGIFFGGNYIGGSPSVNYSGMQLTNQSISTSHITYSFWYKRVLPNSGSSTGMIRTNHPYLGGVNVNSAGIVQWLGDSATEYINFAGNVADGAWHHILVYYPNSSSFSSDSVRAFINGNEVTKSHPPTAFTATTGPVTGIRGTLSQSLPLQVELSNWAVFTTDETSNINTIYNGGTPGDISSLNPFVWLKYDSATTTFDGATGANYGLATDSSGNSNNGNLAGKTDGTTTKLITSNVIARQAANSSGMTEQNLVNNNVSALNGESSGMDTSNLVTSTLTRQIPYNSYSLNFDGTNDYIEIPNNDLFNFVDTNFSISIWLNPDVSHNGIVMSHYYGSDGWGVYYQSGSIRFYDAPVWTTFTTINTNEWTHILIVGDYTGSNLICYKNGIEVYNSSHTFSITDANINLFIASERGTGFFYNGKISNVSLFNEALTSTEALKIYNSGVPGDLSSFNPSPISWWSLGSDSYYNGANYICPDLIGTNNGTSNGMDANALIGDAPNSTANGTSTNMTIDANLTGNAPNSSNNSFSVNMSYDDRVSGSGDVPG